LLRQTFKPCLGIFDGLPDGQAYVKSEAALRIARASFRAGSGYGPSTLSHG
jgi:hypothetical protein